MKSSEMPSSRDLNENEIRKTFVTRLDRLIHMRRNYRHDLNPIGIRLLDRSIEATFQDCLDCGAADVARGLMSGDVPTTETR